MMEQEFFTEEKYIETLIEELPQYGIDTSQWEYEHGDCCDSGIEFISRAIQGTCRNAVKEALKELFEQCKHGDEAHQKWLRDKFDSFADGY